MRIEKRTSLLRLLAALGVTIGFTGGSLWFFGVALANNITSKVTVNQSTPSVTNVTLNNTGAITLTANATTAISVAATITDNNGCGDITNGTATILVYRDAITSSSCLTGGGSAVTNLNCYTATVFTTTSSCISSNQVNTTTTFGIYYFAQATDPSSSYAGKGWRATVDVTTLGATTGTADSASTTLNTLTAINVTTSSINYGALQASSTTGGVNQITTTTNAGNSSTTLSLSVGAALTSGSNSIASDTTQAFSSSTFTYPGTSTLVTAAGVSVSGFLQTSPTSTTNVSTPLYWGLKVPAGTATGSYSGTNVFTAAFAN